MKILPQQVADGRFQNYAKARESLAAELADQAHYIEFSGKDPDLQRKDLQALQTRENRYFTAHRQHGEIGREQSIVNFKTTVQADDAIRDKEGEMALFQKFIALDFDDRRAAIQALNKRCAEYAVARGLGRKQIGSLIQTVRREMIESHDRLITGTAQYVANAADHGYSRAHIEALGRVLHEDLRPLMEQHGFLGGLPSMSSVEHTRDDNAATLHLNNIFSARAVLGNPLADKLFAECNRIAGAGGGGAGHEAGALPSIDIRRADADPFGLRDRTSRNLSPLRQMTPII